MTIVGLCSELLMNLSYIHQAYGYCKNDIPCGGSNPGPSDCESSALTARQGSYPLPFPENDGPKNNIFIGKF